MEPLYVIIAEMSQLVRLGLTVILTQMGYQLNIREINNVEKIRNSLNRDHNCLLIISQSFLGNCNDETIRFVFSKPKKTRMVLIKDIDADMKLLHCFDEFIESDDMEKAIIRKLDKQIQLLTKSTTFSKSTGEISSREKEVLGLVARGLTNKEIAEELFISSHTVITHRKNITSKLGIKTIAGLTVYAVINKLIPPEEIK